MKFFLVTYIFASLLIKHPHFPFRNWSRLYFYSVYSPLPVFLSLVILPIADREYFPNSLMEYWLCYLL